MTEQNYEVMRRAMVSSQLRTTGVDDPRVLAAMGDVPRERYVPADRAALAYVDRAIPLDGGEGLPSPMVLGRLLTEARVRPTDRALIFRPAGGYSAAVLAALAASVETSDEAEGEGSYDLILIDGAIGDVPDALIARLADEGRIATGLVDNGVTRLAIGRKTGGAFGLVPFADADVPVLAGTVAAAGFRF